MVKTQGLWVSVAVMSLAATAAANEGYGAPVGCWEFDEGAGTTATDSCGTHDGTIDGATWTSRGPGYALLFDGIDDWVDLGTSGLLDGEKFEDLTAEAWIRTSGLVPSNYDWGAVFYSESTDGEFGFGVWAEDGRAYSLVYLEPYPEGAELFGPVVTDGQWHQLQLIRNDTEIALYVDGSRYDTVTSAPIRVTNLCHVSIGCKYTTHKSLPFAGEIDNVVVYDHAAPAGCWQLDDGSGTVATDSCGTHDGQVDGAVWLGRTSGYALAFDGIDDWVDLGTSGLLDGSRAFCKVAVEAWIQTTGMMPSNYDWGAAYYEECADGEFGVGVWKDDGRAYALMYVHPHPAAFELFGPVVTDGQWHQLRLVKNSSEAALYVDGIQYDSAEFCESPVRVSNIWHASIGHKYTDHPSLPFAGQIDHVIVYDYGSRCPGDLNDDGFRNVTDFTLFAAAYGSRVCDPHYNLDADLNCDGFVNVTDFTLFADAYGSPCP